jgi:hypothetical protein
VRTSYTVAWCEKGEPELSGKLELAPRGLLFEGERGSRAFNYEDIASMHVEHAGDAQGIVIERRAGPPVRITAAAGHVILFELADQLAKLALGGGGTRLVVVVPIKGGSLEPVRGLLAHGPPFDPDRIGLTRHQVFLSAREAVFVFEASGDVSELERMLAEPGLWSAASAWREHLAGPPLLATAVYAWERAAAAAKVRGSANVL